MASQSLSLSFFFFFFSLSLLAAGDAARPCKTLFISYTFTTSKTVDLDPIATHKPSYFAVYRYFRPVSSRNLHLMIVDRPRAAEVVQSEPSFGMSSLQERAKDILVVVAGLLFGVGCGALTGTIMYLAWSLFNGQYEICRYGDEEEEEDEEEVESPKKMGYVKIGEPVKVKEGYEGH